MYLKKRFCKVEHTDCRNAFLVTFQVLKKYRFPDLPLLKNPNLLHLIKYL